MTPLASPPSQPLIQSDVKASQGRSSYDMPAYDTRTVRSLSAIQHVDAVNAVSGRDFLPDYTVRLISIITLLHLFRGSDHCRSII